MFHPWLKSLSYVTAQSLAKLKTLVGFPASFKPTGGAHGQQAHWDLVHRQYELSGRRRYLLIHNAWKMTY